MPDQTARDTATETLVIPGDCDAQAAVRLHADIAARCAGVRAPLRVDLGPGDPTAFALQLAFAARRSLQARDAFGGWGPAAATALSTDR